MPEALRTERGQRSWVAPWPTSGPTDAGERGGMERGRVPATLGDTLNGGGRRGCKEAGAAYPEVLGPVTRFTIPPAERTDTALHCGSVTCACKNNEKVGQGDGQEEGSGGPH